MPTVVMDVAPEQFTVSPLLLVLMVAAIALVAVVFLLRFRRKKDK
jgi:LPXTG-motif cell wall-anchored protein